MALADSLIRAITALADARLRVDYVVDRVQGAPVEAMAVALDRIALGAEEGDDAAKEVLVSIVDAVNDVRLVEAAQQLREQAAGASLVALDRILRRPAHSTRPRDPRRADRPPDYGYGRPLTLGERKSLARRPDRDLLEKLLLDPHPDVIRGVLRNPRLTEDDLVRLVARRPSRPDVLAEIARATRWVHRPRVRLSLLLNPDMPLDLALPIAGLLLRHELRLVAQSTPVATTLRAACLEHLKRKYPHAEEEDLPVQ